MSSKESKEKVNSRPTISAETKPFVVSMDSEPMYLIYAEDKISAIMATINKLRAADQAEDFGDFGPQWDELNWMTFFKVFNAVTEVMEL